MMMLLIDYNCGDIIIMTDLILPRSKYGDPGKKGANPPTIGAEPSDHKVRLCNSTKTFMSIISKTEEL